ncbi:MAG: hypothetical protein ACR2HJ_01675 [Fimbriimonadales bacterium]
MKSLRMWDATSGTVQFARVWHDDDGWHYDGDKAATARRIVEKYLSFWPTDTPLQIMKRLVMESSSYLSWELIEE